MSALQPDAAEAEPETAFLATLGDPLRPALPLSAAVVVAHPDDETIGCGAQLSRFSDLGIIHATDGAPRNGVDARRLGFAGPAEYAAARRGELEAAVALAGVPADRLISLGWADQEASTNLVAIARKLARLLAGADVVLTHAYEGGHPDHDATALAVHAACALLRRDGGAPEIVEMPLYRIGPDGMAAQSFAPLENTATTSASVVDGVPALSPATGEEPAAECVIELDWEQQRLKQAMYAAHASQHDVLLLFAVDTERFRIAPRYDFAMPPNGGEVWYERHPWGMSSARWQELARAALADLGLDTAP